MKKKDDYSMSEDFYGDDHFESYEESIEGSRHKSPAI